MSAPRYPADIVVLSGTFASQPLAFARLIDAVDRVGGFVDLAQVDVIRHAHEIRLAHYFPPAIVATLQDLRGGDDTLLLLLPDETGQPWRLSIVDDLLHTLGIFRGEVIRASGMGDWT